MDIKDIQQSLAKVNKAAGPEPKVKRIASAEPKVNGGTHFTGDELLSLTASRIVAAFNMEQKGITAEALVAGVQEFEKPFEGRVQ